MSGEDELRRVATHEAGHAVMAHVLGVAPGFVSIRPGVDYAGVATYGKSGRPKMEDGDLDVPIVNMRARLRRGLEREIVTLLAGKASERLVPTEPETGFLPPDPDRERAERLAALAAPGAREAAKLEKVEREGTRGDSDLSRAESKAHGAVGRELEGRYLLFLEALTDSIVATDRFVRLVKALVAPLLAHGILSARAVRMILNEADQRGTA
jgi:hypothetical protein